MNKTINTLLLMVALVTAFGSHAQTPAPAAPAKAASSPRGSRPLLNDVAQELHGMLLEDPKIMGGLFTKPGDDPWQVALVRASRIGPDRRPFCGGSLIASVWVVTAAHCVDNNTLNTDVDVLAGTTDVGVGGVRVHVAAIFVHPNYVPGDIPRNDIALLRTSSALIGPQIDTVAILPMLDSPVVLKDGATVRVTGWGSLAAGGTTVRDLRFVDVRVFTNTDCNDRVAYNKKVKEEMVCAGFAQGGKDSCQGDSGGPLTASLGGKPHLAGIVSWGQGCGKPDRPGVYTRISRFVTWLDDCQAQKPTCTIPTPGT